MNKYKLIIFDFDGTIADTSRGIFNSIKYVQKMMNLPEITPEQMLSHIGPPMDESYNRNFGLTDENLIKAITYHKEYAVKNGYKELDLYEGIIELLNSLKNNNIKVAIATLKAETTAVKILEYLKIKEKFDFIVGADTINPLSKSQMINKIISLAKANIADTLMIGDSKYDALAAQESGIDFIAVTYGFGFASQKDVMKFKNIGYFNSAKEINRFLSNK